METKTIECEIGWGKLSGFIGSITLYCLYGDKEIESDSLSFLGSETFKLRTCKSVFFVGFVITPCINLIKAYIYYAFISIHYG